MSISVLGLAVGAHTPNPLHAEERLWVEKNCYIDVWIEALHALKLDPVPLLAFTVALDFWGDQWTFFKPPHTDIHTLYGIDVQELNVWRPLAELAAHHLAAGRFIFTEADAWYLPDTQGTDYRRQHVKTTIALETLDVEARKLGYFHNGGYHGLEGEDFDGVFRRGGTWDAHVLPLFAELVNVDRLERLPREVLRARSRELLTTHLRRRPATNPLARFAQSFPAEVDALKSKGIDAYHAYAFATLRQLGSNFELAAIYLRWLDAAEPGAFEAAAAAMESISSAAKTLILKGARAVMTKKPSDFSELLGTMQVGWDQGMALLVPYAG